MWNHLHFDHGGWYSVQNAEPMKIDKKNEIGHQLTFCWCPGGDGGGCVQGCDATGEHYQITLSTGFLGSEQLDFLDWNNLISLV